MSIPDFQSIMLPLLQLMGDGKEHFSRELTESLAGHFQLTQEDREQLLPRRKPERVYMGHALS